MKKDQEVEVEEVAEEVKEAAEAAMKVLQESKAVKSKWKLMRKNSQLSNELIEDQVNKWIERR